MKKYKLTFTGIGNIEPLRRFITDKEQLTTDTTVFSVQTPVYGNKKMKYVEHTFDIYELEKEGIVTIEEVIN